MTDSSAKDEFRSLLAPSVRQAEQDVDLWLIEPGVPEALAQAMRYGVLGGGKRIRPALTYLAAQAVGQTQPSELTRRAAVAVELVHCYSLVHDDLPAMDDDDLRRGRPTLHVTFGQAMAILAGDALLTRAFGVLAESGEPAAVRLSAELAAAAGAAGMIAGQVADMKLCPVPDGPEGLRYIHLRKTAGLLKAPVRMGALSAGGDADDVEALTRCAERLGLAYQLTDDMLDVTGDARELGKTPGKDARGGKRTHVAEMGVRAAADLRARLTAEAVAALDRFAGRGQNLAAMARLLADRTY